MLEMFKKYQFMYSVMIATHPWVYVYPLHCILHKFRKYCDYKDAGQLLSVILLSVAIVNHPHPTLYEYFLWISLFVNHHKLVFEVKASFLLAVFWIIGIVMAHVMWTIWNERIGGNANFFYFQTIICNLVVIGFIVSLLYLIVEKTNYVSAI